MKRIIETKDENHLETFLDERVTLFCCRYIYTGKLVSIDETSVRLTDASIVYETGALNTKDWQDAQPLPNDWYVKRASIESFGKLK